jgi:hypothetical protein
MGAPRVPHGNSRPSGQWDDDDFDVLANGEVVGRIYKANAAPVGSPVRFGPLRVNSRTHVGIGGDAFKPGPQAGRGRWQDWGWCSWSLKTLS